MRIIKSATLTGTYDWVYPLDDALNRDGWRADEELDDEARQASFNAELDAALESNDTPRLQALCVPGQSPVRFKLRHLAGDAKRYLTDHALTHMVDEAEGRVATTTLRIAAALALKAADGLTGPDGLPYEIKHVQHKESGQQQVRPKIMDDLETIHGGALVSLMGSVVLGRLTASGN